MLSLFYAVIADKLAAMNALVPSPQIGREHLLLNDPPPRVMIWPTVDAFGPVQGPGGNPKSIATVTKTSQVVIWGRTRDEVEGMRDQMVLAIRQAAKTAMPNTARSGQVTLGAGAWTTLTEIGKNGHEYRMTFTVDAAIVERRWETPAPGGEPQSPDASSYTGTQADTWIKVKADRAVTLDYPPPGAPVPGDVAEVNIERDDNGD